MNECVNGSIIKIAPTGVGIPLKKCSGSPSVVLDFSNHTLYKASLKQENIMKAKAANAPIPFS